MKIHQIAVASLLLCISGVAVAQNYGSYVGNIDTRWMKDGRKMRILAEFTYVDPKGVSWLVPKNWVVDGASIPRLAWSISGGPFEGKYRDASVFHDVSCDQKERPWEAVHEAFYWGMLASGVESWRAKAMYAAVYHFGPRWPKVITVHADKGIETSDVIETALKKLNSPEGSSAEVIRIVSAGTRKETVQFSAKKAGGPTTYEKSIPTANYVVKVSSPQSMISEDKFKYLAANIQANEISPGRELSLADIREFKY